MEREVEEFKQKQRAPEDEERNGEDERGGGANGETPKVPDTVGADNTDIAEKPNTTQDDRTNGTAAPISTTPAPDLVRKEPEKENGDDSGEVMLEADEDTVIY